MKTRHYIDGVRVKSAILNLLYNMHYVKWTICNFIA